MLLVQQPTNLSPKKTNHGSCCLTLTFCNQTNDDVQPLRTRSPSHGFHLMGGSRLRSTTSLAVTLQDRLCRSCGVEGENHQKIIPRKKGFPVFFFYLYIPSRKLTYPPKMAFWVDDFPNFPRWVYRFYSSIWPYLKLTAAKLLRALCLACPKFGCFVFPSFLQVSGAKMFQGG